jgi:hypothetical protein
MSANTIGCGCSSGQSNTGDDGQQLFGTTVAKYMFSTIAADGTRNGIDLNAASLGQELISKVNHVDPTKRFYPIYELKNVAPEKADPTMWTADDGYEVKLLDGIKKQNHLLVGVSPQFYNKVKSMCGAQSEILVDDCGNLQGAKDSKTGDTLYGRRVNNLSYNADFSGKTNSDPSQVMMSYQYSRIDGDNKLWLIPASAFSTFDPLDLLGMLDVNLTATPLTNTTIQIDATFDYGTAVTLKAWIGALAADITVVNITSGSSPVIDTVVADATVDGRYVITMSAPLPTTADNLRVDAFRAATAVSLNGYEGSSAVVVSL